MHTIKSYGNFITSDGKVFIDSNAESFQFFNDEYSMSELENTSFFTKVYLYLFEAFVFNIGKATTTNLFTSFSFVFGELVFRVRELISNNKFSPMRIGKIVGIWFSNLRGETPWETGEDVETIWVKKSDTDTIWTKH